MTPSTYKHRTAERERDTAAVVLALILLTTSLAATAVVVTRLIVDLLGWAGQAFWGIG